MDAVDQVAVTVVIDPQLDMLLTDQPSVRRFGMVEHFAPPNREPIMSENGACFWIEISDSGRTHHVMYDAGLTGGVALHNCHALGRSTDQLEAIVISHAHPDHYRGLIPLLQARSTALAVHVQPDAFLPKLLIDEEGQRILTINAGMDRDLIRRAGGTLLEDSDPTQIAPGLSLTGGIERIVDYEPPVPPRDSPAGAFVERDGVLENDDAAIDEQALVLNVRGKGLVVITACGHAGIINTIRKAREMTGVDSVHALIGGFHFGYPGVPRANAEAAFDELSTFDLDLIAPMHCSGIWAQGEVMRRFPDAFLQNVTGTTVTFAT